MNLRDVHNLYIEYRLRHLAYVVHTYIKNSYSETIIIAYKILYASYIILNMTVIYIGLLLPFLYSI